MAGMNQRNNDCTVYTPRRTDGFLSLSPYGETDFNRPKTSQHLDFFCGIWLYISAKVKDNVFN